MSDEFQRVIEIPLWLKLIFSILCVIGIIIHTFFSNLYVIDLTTVSLLLLFLIPWLLHYIDIIKIPGGGEILFKKEIHEKLNNLTKKGENKEVLTTPTTIIPIEYDKLTPIYDVIDEIFGNNPNSAIIASIIEIEKKIRELALVSKIQTQNKSILKILEELTKERRLRNSDLTYLKDVIKFGEIFLIKEAKTDPASALEIIRAFKDVLRWLYAHVYLVNEIDYRFENEE